MLIIILTRVNKLVIILTSVNRLIIFTKANRLMNKSE